LHAAARAVVRDRGGVFPATIEEWTSLPGIGAYTAAAVGSLAQNLDAAVVDGNVIRVLSRLLADGRLAKEPAGRRFFQDVADRLLVRGRSGEFNEAVMELGAMVCRPKSPLCGACPLEGVCRARAEGDPARYPVRKASRPKPYKVVGAAVISNRRGEILLARRHDEGFLGGLWEFPGGKREPGESLPACIARELKEEMALDLAVGDLLTVVEHEYSHFTIELHAYRARIRRGRPRCLQCADYAWVKPGEMHRYPLSRADHHIADAVRGGGRDVPAGKASRRRA
jgi:A/G-specific adenine glycosylase